MLHVTNGDAAVERMRAGGLEGEFLPWRDVLHEGPVPPGLGVAEIGPVRAKFIASQGWGERDAVARDFADRAATLARRGEHDAVVLWFEHDLYDQLQLVQVLDAMAGDGEGDRCGADLVCIDEYLGTLPADRFPPLLAGRPPVTRGQFALARTAWRAFTAPDPSGLDELRRGDTAALPFLAAALHRLLGELPAVGTGLSRTEAQILTAIAAGRDRLGEAFAAQQEGESAVFLGDTVFASIVERLGTGVRPLVSRASGERFAAPHHDAAGPDRAVAWAQRLAVTEDGRAVLAGELDHVALNDVHRWLGGVHLRGRASPWRWDPEADRVVSVGPAKP